MNKALRSLITIGLIGVLCQSCAEGAPQPFGPTDSGRDTASPMDSDAPRPDATGDAMVADADAMAADADAMAADADAMVADADAMVADADAMVADADAMVADADAMVADAMPPFIPPTVDGTLASGEWSGAEMSTNALASDWGVGLNELSTLFAGSDGAFLWVGIEGVVESTNTIVVYVDVDGTASGFRDLLMLDNTGGLDDSLSSFITPPSGFAADFGFGARGMNHIGAGFDDQLGWRELVAGDFPWLDSADAPAACGVAACETRISASALGVGSGDTVRLFARIVNAAGLDASNQTLPEDMAAAPATVGVSLSVLIP